MSFAEKVAAEGAESSTGGATPPVHIHAMLRAVRYIDQLETAPALAVLAVCLLLILCIYRNPTYPLRHKHA